MFTPRGKANKRITFQRATVTRSPLGGKTPGAGDWQQLGTPRWAKVLFGTGAERRAAAVEQATQAATFRVLADSLTTTVTVEDRIAFAGMIFDITGIAPVDNAEIEFTGMTRRG